MYVSDVQDAFLLIPLAPWVWFFMLFRWFSDSTSCTDDCLLAHLFADFGSRGMPGTFKVFLVDVVVNMARSEMVFTLPLVIYVDDGALIGAVESETNAEMGALQAFTSEYTGVVWKWAKDKPAAQSQLYIGFVWDSRDFSLCLEERKIVRYLEDLAGAAASASLTLKQRQSLAGKMQRAIRTLPPGAACLLVNCFLMMQGLSLPWHSRRTTRAERQDYKFVHDMLQLNGARGYYSYDGFGNAPGCLSDAFKRQHEAGGGYVSADGFYDWYVYGRSAARKPIDELEGDTVLRCCEALCGRWKGMQVPFGIDNSSFERSAEKSRSRAPRLNELLRHLFILQVKYGFVLQPYWLSSEDNYLADHLSRGRVAEFLELVGDAGFLRPAAVLFKHPSAGRMVTFGDGDRKDSMSVLRQLLDSYSSNVSKDGALLMLTLPLLRLRGGAPARVGDAQHLSVPYARASVFTGLPPEYMERADQIMDNRLAASSTSKMMVAYRRWETFCDTRGWCPLIDTDDPDRGGRMAAWVISMVDETELVFKSISTYVWGMRVWHVLQHEADPAYGVMHWREFMAAVAVLTSVPGEPREEVPFEVLEAILRGLDMDDFEDVNLGCVVLTLYFTFSRTECPCPKAHTGPNAFDPTKHWTWEDFRLVRMHDRWVLWIRFKGYKQDPRMERAEVAHAAEFLPFQPGEAGESRDWVPVGDVEERPEFSISRFVLRHCQLLGRQRRPGEAMFLCADRKRPYTYGALMADFRKKLAAVGADVKLGPHGLRVRGYNDSRDANGEDLTVVHGGWRSSAHSRYARFAQRAVLGIPAAMLGETNPFTGARQVSRTVVARGAAAQVDDPDDGDEDQVDGFAAAGAQPASRSLPDGYTRADRVAEPSGRKYPIYTAPDGTVCSSAPHAWRHYLSSARPNAASSPRPTLSPRRPNPARRGAVSPPARLHESAAHPTHSQSPNTPTRHHESAPQSPSNHNQHIYIHNKQKAATAFRRWVRA